MMNPSLRIPVLAGVFVLVFATVSAEEGKKADTEPRKKWLALNQTLAARFAAEYQRLKAEEAAEPTERLKRELEAVEYKMKALREDAARIQSLLPKEEETTDQMHNRALAEVAGRDLGSATALYQQIILKNPEDDAAYVLLGHCYLLQGEFEKAREAFENAVHIEPGNIREIAPFYEDMILQNPQDDDAYTNLGYAYLWTGQSQKARDAFVNALSINPANPAARAGLQELSQTQPKTLRP